MAADAEPYQLDEHVWHFHQHRERVHDIHYTGHVYLVGGAEGTRLRTELAAVVKELLEWASTDGDDG